LAARSRQNYSPMAMPQQHCHSRSTAGISAYVSVSLPLVLVNC
jgi:hypothetical protein